MREQQGAPRRALGYDPASRNEVQQEYQKLPLDLTQNQKLSPKGPSGSMGIGGGPRSIFAVLRAAWSACRARFGVVRSAQKTIKNVREVEAFAIVV